MSRKRATLRPAKGPAHVPEHLRNAASELRPLYVDEKAASQLTGYTCGYVRKQRLLDSGPPYRKIGRTIRYNVVELLAWIESQAHYPQQSQPHAPLTDE